MKGLLLGCALALAGAGCGHARYVHKDADGGVVAMSHDTGGNRKKALKLIEDHVGPGFVIVKEGEVVTGQTVRNHADTQSELTSHSRVPFLPAERQTTVTTSTTTDVTEYRIEYRRANAPVPSLPLVNGVPVGPGPVRQAGAQVPAPKPAGDKPSSAGGPTVPGAK